MRVLTFDEAAALATLTRRSIERHLAQGTGPATISLGRRRKGILDVDLEAWLRARRTPAPGEHSSGTSEAISAPAPAPKADASQAPRDVRPGGKFRRKVPAPAASEAKPTKNRKPPPLPPARSPRRKLREEERV
jgi:hypothetical protein